MRIELKKTGFWLACTLGILVSLEASGLPEATYKDVSYGSHPKQTMDVWLAEGEGPTPLVIYIHGGGWLGGDKLLKAGSAFEKSALAYLAEGISFVSIDYRLNTYHTLPIPVLDAARALQFARSQSEEWHLDKSRVGLMGGSAGGCTCLWLAFHDDLADPDSADPVARESTRVSGVYVVNGQSSIDPLWIRKNIGKEGSKHRMIFKAVGASSLEDALANYEKFKDLYWEFSPINHLDREDPPYWGMYGMPQQVPAKNQNNGIHHPAFGAKLKERSEKVGHHGTISRNEKGTQFLIGLLKLN